MIENIKICLFDKLTLVFPWWTTTMNVSEKEYKGWPYTSSCRCNRFHSSFIWVRGSTSQYSCTCPLSSTSTLIFHSWRNFLMLSFSCLCIVCRWASPSVLWNFAANHWGQNSLFARLLYRLLCIEDRRCTHNNVILHLSSECFACLLSSLRCHSLSSVPCLI